MTAMTVPRMTRATWYKHRFSVVGIPAVFLLAALVLFADSVVRRHWLSVHHLSGCLVANTTTGGSWCVSNVAWASFSDPSQTPTVIAVAVLALPVLAGLFAGVPWVARVIRGTVIAVIGLFPDRVQVRRGRLVPAGNQGRVPPW